MRTPEDYHRLSATASESRRFDVAVDMATKAIAQDPGYAGGYGSLALGLTGLKRYDEAIENARRAIALDPCDVQLCMLLANAHELKSEYDEAMKHIEVAIQIDPEDPGPLRLKGRILMAQKKATDAIDPLKKALQLDPSCFDSTVELAAAYIWAKKFDLAEPVCRDALAINPDEPNALHNLGICLDRRRNFLEAARVYRAAIMANPNSRMSKLNFVRMVNQILGELSFILPPILALMAYIGLNHKGYTSAGIVVAIGLSAFGLANWILYLRKIRQLKKSDPELLNLYRSIQKNG